MSRFFSPKYLKYRGALRGGEITSDRPCEQCNYNLRGLRYEGTCPECGATIEVASATRDALSDAPLDQVRRLGYGFWVALACVPLLPLGGIGAAVMSGRAGIVLMIMLVLSTAWVIAVWCMTPVIEIPGGTRRGFAPRARLRHAARWTQTGWPLSYLLAAIVVHMPNLTPRVAGMLQVGSGLASLVGLAGIVLLAILLGRLAEWCQDDFAQRHFNYATWGLTTCTVGLAFAAAFTAVQLLACMFVVLWVASLASFFLAVLSLARAVTWSVVHSRERIERDRELKAKMAERFSAPGADG